MSIRSRALWVSVSATVVFTVATFLEGRRLLRLSSPRALGSTTGVGALTFSQDVVVTLFLLFFTVIGYTAAFSIFFDFVAHTSLLVMVSSTESGDLQQSEYSPGQAVGIVSGCAVALGMAILVMTLQYGAHLSRRTGNPTLHLMSLLFAVIAVFSVFSIANTAVRASLDASLPDSDVAELVREVSLLQSSS